MRHNFIDIEDFSAHELSELAVRAEFLKNTDLSSPIFMENKNKILALIFLENSTRTRISFEIAAKKLGLTVIGFDSEKSSLEKGESIKDTVLTLKALGVNAIVLRASSASSINQVAKWIQIPVINAGNAMRSHPTQAIGDFITIREAIKDRKFVDAGIASPDEFSKLKIGIVGDIIHSRVARSLGELFEKFGASTYLIGPRELLPRYDIGFPVKMITDDFGDCIQDLDIIIALRIQLERLREPFLVNPINYRDRYGITKSLMADAKPTALVMHPGPQVRDLEIDSDIVDSDCSLILKQVENSIYARMAVLSTALNIDIEGVMRK